MKGIGLHRNLDTKSGHFGHENGPQLGMREGETAWIASPICTPRMGTFPAPKWPWEYVRSVAASNTNTPKDTQVQNGHTRVTKMVAGVCPPSASGTCPRQTSDLDPSR